MNEFDLIIGAQVYCQDGKCGKLSKIAVEPDARQVTHLIVEEGFLLKRARVLPLSVVVQAAAGDIYLAIEKDELLDYPDYQEHEVERPAPGYSQSGTQTQVGDSPFGAGLALPVPMIREKIRRGVLPTLAVIERGIPIKNLERTLGKLDHVLAEPEDGRITRLVMQQGLLFPEQRLLPISLVEGFGEHGISVAALQEDLKELRHYTGLSEKLWER
jgi:uncharacterized protein YrrD